MSTEENSSTAQKDFLELIKNMIRQAGLQWGMIIVRALSLIRLENHVK